MGQTNTAAIAGGQATTLLPSGTHVATLSVTWHGDGVGEDKRTQLFYPGDHPYLDPPDYARLPGVSV